MASKETRTLDDLFFEELKDIYYVEHKLLKALKKLSEAVHSDSLREAFLDHREQTETHIDRLEEVFEMIDEKPASKDCPAIDGIISEAETLMKEYKDQPALDAGLLAGAQAAEHYEIARYGTLQQWAERLGLPRAAELLGETLEEEEETDRALTGIARSGVNQSAAAA